jgi:DNA repair protein RadA/Sms
MALRVYLGGMSKEKTQFICEACGGTSPKWLGKCPQCEAWNTLVEQRQTAILGPSKHRYAPLAASSAVTPLGSIESRDFERTPTGIPEFDRVLGGGIVQGSVILLGGEPGVGKSTLLLQAMDALDRQGMKVLYVSGEESGSQVAMRADRLGIKNSPMEFQSEIQLERILETVAASAPQILVIDSIQAVWTDQLTAAPGSVSQVKDCAAQIARFAKANNIATILVGHVTKENQIAGPKILEHIVDCVAQFESDANSAFRIIRATKNRFGAVNEVGIFAMTETGLKSVTNPSAIFLSSHTQPVPGSSIMATIDGTRPILVEIQALVDGGGPSPRRLSIGLERDRLAMLLAVLNRHGAVQTSDQDVFVNAVGGLKISEPAADLAVILSIQSSLCNIALPKGLLVFGEVGLAGEVRAAPKASDRLHEAVKLGFSKCIVPRANAPKKGIAGMTVHSVERVEEALDLVRSM